MKKLIIFLTVALSACCAKNPWNNLQIAMMDLECETRGTSIIIVEFNSKISLCGGAGCTVGLRRVFSDNGRRYSGDNYILWEKNGEWFMFEPKIINGELKPSEEALLCKITRRYSPDEIINWTKHDPYIQVTKDGVIYGEFE